MIYGAKGSCKLCSGTFAVSFDYHRMGLCDDCARRAGASYVMARSGQPDPHLDPAAYAEFAAERRSERESNPPKQAITAKLRLRIFERDGYRCKKCGGCRKLRVDHIWPESKGGTLAEANLQTLCESCNNGKRDRIPEGAVQQ